jgi:hypothetical protein
MSAIAPLLTWSGSYHVENVVQPTDPLALLGVKSCNPEDCGCV